LSRLLKHVTCLCFVDIPLHVIRQKEPSLLQFLSSLCHGVYVTLVVLIALYASPLELYKDFFGFIAG
jgi:hypothetical protein